MKLSVALCTYNGEKFLREQLDSILNQTLKIDEIVICDEPLTILAGIEEILAYVICAELETNPLPPNIWVEPDTIPAGIEEILA